MEIENEFINSFKLKQPKALIYNNEPFLLNVTAIVTHDGVNCYRFELIPLTDLGRSFFSNMSRVRKYGFFSYDDDLLVDSSTVNRTISLIDYQTFFNRQLTYSQLYTDAQNYHQELTFYKPYDLAQFNEDVLNDLDHSNALIDKAKAYKMRWLRLQLNIDKH